MTTPIGADALALIEKADGALSVYKAIHAEHEGKEMPAAKAAEADAAYAEFEKFEAEARKAGEAATRHQKGEDFAAYKARLAESAGRVAVGGTPPMSSGDDDDSIVYKARDGKEKRFTPDRSVRNGWTAKAERDYSQAFRRFIAGSASDEDRGQAVQKALSVGSDIAGGFWVASEVFATELIEALEDLVFMRQLGTVMPSIPQGARLGFRTAGDLDAAEWTTEVSTATADTATPAGQRWLTPHPLSKLALVSTTLLGANAGAEAYVRGEIAARFAAAEETAFMTGDGQGKPQGVFSSTSTLPTDVTCTSSTDIAYADLLNVEFALKSQYRAGASWIMHRTILKELHSLVDGAGVPLLRRDPVAQSSHNLFGYPVNESEYAPSSSATGLYVGALGNWKRAYRIVDSLAMKIQRLEELYALTKQVGFLAEKETDGAITDGNGIVRLKMA